MPWDRVCAEAHLEELATRHDIQLIWTDKPECAYSRHRIVWIRKPYSPESYLGALHELGHVVSPRARKHEARWDRGRNKVVEYDDELLMEAAAWAWAAWHMLPELADTIPARTWKLVGGYLSGYIAQVRDQHIG